MKQVIPAFEEASCSIEEALSGKELPGYQKITCHLIFYVLSVVGYHPQLQEKMVGFQGINSPKLYQAVQRSRKI